jgi:hypothetical protein
VCWERVKEENVERAPIGKGSKRSKAVERLQGSKRNVPFAIFQMFMAPGEIISFSLEV